MTTVSKSAARRGVVIALSCVFIVPIGQVAAVSPRETAISVPTLSIHSRIDTAGIPEVTGVRQPHPKSEAEAQAVSDAQVFAERHPDSVGYPWLDAGTGSLKLSASNAAGARLLDDQRAAVAVRSKSVKVLVRSVRASLARLNAISDDITTLRAKGVPDADLIYSTVPDYESDRIVIRVRAASPKLFAALARAYGTDAIAVWIDPAGAGGSTMSRQDDVSPYWGGAKIGTPGFVCSDAFSWTIGTTTGNAMLTAAHCIAAGGNVTIGASTTVRGTVTTGSEENWSNSVGTQYYNGQSTYRGDVALIRLKSTVTSAAQIWRGSATSSSHSSVVATLRRYSYPDENVYAGGERKGETGPYHINMVGVNWWYSADGPSVVVKNIVVAPLLFSSDPFLDHGDSGGSVFRVDGSGNVTAVGTISGIAGTSSLVFTDIYNTYLALPGDLNF